MTVTHPSWKNAWNSGGWGSTVIHVDSLFCCHSSLSEIFQIWHLPQFSGCRWLSIFCHFLAWVGVIHSRLSCGLREALTDGKPMCPSSCRRRLKTDMCHLEKIPTSLSLCPRRLSAFLRQQTSAWTRPPLFMTQLQLTPLLWTPNIPVSRSNCQRTRSNGWIRASEYLRFWKILILIAIPYWNSLLILPSRSFSVALISALDIYVCVLDLASCGSVLYVSCLSCRIWQGFFISFSNFSLHFNSCMLWNELILASRQFLMLWAVGFTVAEFSWWW